MYLRDNLLFNIIILHNSNIFIIILLNILLMELISDQVNIIWSQILQVFEVKNKLINKLNFKEIIEKGYIANSRLNVSRHW